MEKEVVLARLHGLRTWMQEENLRGFVVRDVTNIAWLTGFEGVFDEERAHTLIITADKAILHTDSRYEAACRQAALALDGAIRVDATRGMGVSAFIQQELGGEAGPEAPAPRPFALEDDITLAEYRAIEQLQAAQEPLPKETHQVIKTMRAVKTPAELDLLQKAQDIADAAFEHIKAFVQPGLTERDVQMELNDYMFWSGAEALSFPSIVAFGANAAKPHAIPGDTKLEAGQVLLLDFGAKYRGYCSDMTRCIFLGEPTPAVRKIYNTVVEANEAVQAMLKPGVTGAEAHALAEEILAKGGYEGKMGHGLGHGVGMEVHEEPCLSPRNTSPLQVGNVVTVEPGIYLPDGEMTMVHLPMVGTQAMPVVRPMGVRVEDFGVITEDGFRVFTKTPHDIVII